MKPALECFSQRGTGPVLHSPWTSAWFLAIALSRDILVAMLVMDINTDPCNYRATDPDMTFNGSSGWGFTMYPDDRASHSAGYFFLPQLSVPSRFIMLKLFHFSFFPI